MADSKRKILVLMYHGVDTVGNREYNNRHFSILDFERQIRLFKKHAHILSHDDFVNNNLSKDRLNIVITFDDGYENNFKYALPVLEKLEAHAYFFVTGMGNEPIPILWADAVDIVAASGMPGAAVSVDGVTFQLNNGRFTALQDGEDLKAFVKRCKEPGGLQKQKLVQDLLGIVDFTANPDMADYWKLMSNEQIKEAAASPFITIGSHGYYHNNLGSLSLNDGIEEVLKSRNYLEGITGKVVDSLAFPDGSYTTELSDRLINEGFDNQFLVNYRYDDNNRNEFVNDRFGLYPFQGNPNEVFYQILKSE
jgi:peptidoglycan/xylan/chitin deacetylase (PgdA/CDA1 family)